MGTANTHVDPVELHLPFDPQSASEARRKLTLWLNEHQINGEAFSDARLIISELVGNAVRHARPDGEGGMGVSWVLKGLHLTLSVSDGGGPSLPTIKSASETDVGGRGLLIVESVADQLWVDVRANATQVFAQLRVA